MVYKLKGHFHTLVGCSALEDKPEIITADASGVLDPQTSLVGALVMMWLV